MAYIRKIKGSLVRQDSSEYVGEDTYLFYDIVDGCLRMHDGTPGGAPICGGNTGSGGVEEYDTIGDFPNPGTSDVIYIAADTNTIYRWDGSVYVPLSSASAGGGVIEYPNLASFPAVGSTNVIYLDASTDRPYRWNGTGYAVLDGHDITVSTVLSLSTATIYSTDPVTANLTLKFIISVLEPAGGNFSSSEILVSYKKFDDSLSFTHYAIIGDKIKFKVRVSYAGGIISLEIINNETNPLSISVSRLPTGSV